ncbi:hypothetical protein HNQ91_002487 [Filimonas zeae]|uniref:Uncharacterized protein n=1 Tax=Filimonas zeae TaxID=1737353 RepID=A0A917MTX6_9BACT|nr:hypothetical protein [Filimonas zeae]MDR6339436.1 hypothetical protein [Filimonas zeae]GGH63608.1 hypothetical protein GCM10011379_14710 [Filimonas zeae]
MKYLFRILFRKLKRNYYYAEIKQVSMLTAVALVAWVLYAYGTDLAHAALTNTGMTYITFLLVAIVLGQVIRLYYRIMVIKYAEKDTRIELFNGLHKKA